MAATHRCTDVMAPRTVISGSDPAGLPLRSHGKVLPEHARAHNRALVLQHLFRDGPTSRAALARATGLTRVTVSDLVVGLLVSGLVEELGPQAAGRVGKPATLLAMRTAQFRMVVVDVGTGIDLAGGVTDLRGSFVSRRSVSIDGRSNEDLLALVASFCRLLVASAGGPVLGVGVAVPGIVRTDGIVEDGAWRGWSRMPLAERLSEMLGQPVHVVNDADAAALCERTFGSAQGPGLLVVHVREGVGAGIVLDGALLRGEHDAAGEIGHVRAVEEAGERCRCGRLGCLQTILGVSALERRMRGLDDDGRRRAGEDLGRILARTLAPVVGALDVADVVLSGPVDLVDGPLRESAERELRDRVMPAIADSVRVRMATVGAHDVLLGAAARVLAGQLGVS